MYKKIRFMILPTSLLIFCFCTGPKTPEVTPGQKTAFSEGRLQAARLYASGRYTGLREACTVLRPLIDIPAFRAQAGAMFIKSALLLTVREKELGIIRHDAFREADALVKRESAFAPYASYLEIVEHLPDKTKGVIGPLASESETSQNDAMDAHLDWIHNRLPVLNQWLQSRATSTDFDAYLYLSLNSAFSAISEDIADEEDRLRFPEIFPDSNLLGFKMLTGPIPDQDGLQKWLTDHPEFYEAHFYLGELALSSGLMLSAERHYLQAFDRIPDSTSLAISLSKVYFHSEELEKSLAYDLKALELAPTYRDALLGQAMCLAYLGRHPESLAVLNKMLELGKYYIGETWYWTAWNHNELESMEEARAGIDKARHYLIGHNDVSTLDGIISYKRKQLDDAEQDFLEALRLQPHDCEAAYWLGKVYADKVNWRYSGVYFEKGADCHAGQSTACETRILEIEGSDMSRARKDSLIRKKKLQILQLRNTEATCRFNAAASFFNAGVYDKALALAEQAAAHPNFKQSAERLIQGIKDRKSP